MANTVDPIEAALDEIDAEDGQIRGGGLRKFLPAAGAFFAIAAFGAVVWYAYSTGVREGSEIAAPLLKPSGPSKIAPQDPGGREILDRDKRVYGVIDKTAGGRQVERLLPPPENPLPLPVSNKPPLASEKLAVPKAPPPPPSITAPAKLPDAPKQVASVPPAPLPALKPSQADSSPSAVKPAVAPIAKPAVPPPAKPAVPPPPKPALQKTAPVKSVKAVPKPVPRVSAIKGDGYRVQISSLRSAEAAKREWAKRVKQSGGALDGLTLFVKRVEIAKRGIYYRVQAGPLADRAAAGRLCDTLKRRKIGCLVVKP